MCGPGSSLSDPVCRADGNNRLKLEVIYFISWDYKFNLQTRGQNFSLTRGRESLQALVQEETTLITNYTFQSVFDVLLLPSSLLFFGRGADFNCGTTTRLPPRAGEQPPVCCHRVSPAAGLGAAHSSGHILMAPLSYKAWIVFHVILVNFAAGKGIGFPCELLIRLPQRGEIY